MQQLYSSISCNLDPQVLAAAYPLLANDRVEAIEWSFDALYKVRDIPDWFEELLTIYGRENRLVGHGIFFSIFSGRWLPEQQDWLNALRETARRYSFDHITEHFGFMSGSDFHQGAPLSIPFTASTLAIGQDRLKRIQEAAGCAVGLENLAFSYSLDDVKKHGEFLSKLVEPVNGFIILDLHNLYCQLNNFSVGFEEIIAAYPLDRVREIHISGGSWDDIETPVKKTVRRDTHDHGVPAEVFDLLSQVTARCSQLKYVVLEQFGTALHTGESQRQYQEDFGRMDAIIKAMNLAKKFDTIQSFLPAQKLEIGAAVEDELLYHQQLELTAILETAPDYTTAATQLAGSSLANSYWAPEHWAPYMLETARKIAQKWKDGFV